MQQKSFLGHSPSGFHKIAYVEWGQPSALPPVVCVHGLIRNGRDFDRLAETLQHERRVFCPDMAGRGTSGDLADPAQYGYPQYLADMTALIARTGVAEIDWVGTSMGGIIGMLLAAAPKTPIRRLVINDVGPLIPRAGLKRIGDYVGQRTEFANIGEVEKHLRKIYAPFGIARDEDWKQFAAHSYRALPNGKLTLAHDPAIAQNFAALDQDIDLWNVYDKIRCPVLVLRGSLSDILSADVAQDMTRRGPKAQLVECPGIGHAPALMDEGQIDTVIKFLRA